MMLQPLIRLRQAGFTVMEMMVVLVIIGILSAMAMPSIQNGIIRKQIEAAMPLADVARKPVEVSWQLRRKFPANNHDTGLPVAEKIVSNYVSAVSVENGAVNITFGNRAHPKIAGKVLTLRPAVVPDAPVVPISWLCAGAEAPKNMVAHGADRTTIAEGYLPSECHKKH